MFLISAPNRWLTRAAKTIVGEPKLSLPGTCSAFRLLTPILVYKTGRTAPMGMRVLTFGKGLGFHGSAGGIEDLPKFGGLRQPALFVQDYAKEATVYRQRAVARVIDKAQRPELVHEMTDP